MNPEVKFSNSGIETQKTFRIKQLPELAVIENLDSDQQDRDMILGLLRNKQLTSSANLLDLLGEIKSFKDKEYDRFFIKSKQRINKIRDQINFILGRTFEDPINSKVRSDFDRQARYARTAVLSEIILSKKVKEIVASKEVQELALRYGFSSIKFSEPIVALIYKKDSSKYLIYRNVATPQSRFIFGDDLEHLEKLAQDLRKIFFKNGIYPHDLRWKQFMMTEEDGNKKLVLVDIEAYTKSPETEDPQKRVVEEITIMMQEVTGRVGTGGQAVSQLQELRKAVDTGSLLPEDAKSQAQEILNSLSNSI